MVKSTAFSKKDIDRKYLIYSKTRNAQFAKYMKEVKAIARKAHPNFVDDEVGHHMRTLEKIVSKEWPEFDSFYSAWFRAKKSEGKLKFSTWIKRQIEEQQLGDTACMRLGEYWAYNHFIIDIYELDPLDEKKASQQEQDNLAEGDFVWAAVEEFPERDFVALAYSLYFTKILRLKRGNQDMFTKALAKSLNYPLGSNYKVNYSKRSSKAKKADTKTAIFQKLAAAIVTNENEKKVKRTQNNFEATEG